MKRQIRSFTKQTLAIFSIFALLGCEGGDTTTSPPKQEGENTPIEIIENNENDNNNSESTLNHIPKILTDAQAIRFLNKTTFGATKESIEELKNKGVEKWIAEQFSISLDDRVYLRKTIELAKETQPTINPYSVDDYLADNEKVFNKNEA